MATPDPQEVAPWYLRNINQALALNSATGNVYVRTDAQLTVGNVGNVIVSEVSVNDLGNVDISGNTMPVSGNVTVAQGTTPWSVAGNVTASLTGNSLPTGKPWQLQVAQGQIAGVAGLSISGYGAGVGTNFIPAWELDTAYTYLPSAQVVRVWSSSTSDTNVSVLINGLDSNYVLQTETVVLNNGITGVLSIKQFLRINGISITGSVQNIGTISVGNSGKTITSAVIGNVSNVTAGRSQMTVYTVPAGYTFYLTQSNWYTNQTGSQTALYRSWTQSPSGIVNIVLTFPMQQQYNSTKVVPRPYTEKTDIQWQVASSSGTSKIGGQIEGYLIAN
jgi:hypothetical protein